MLRFACRVEIFIVWVALELGEGPHQVMFLLESLTYCSNFGLLGDHDATPAAQGYPLNLLSIKLVQNVDLYPLQPPYEVKVAEPRLMARVLAGEVLHGILWCVHGCGQLMLLPLHNVLGAREECGDLVHLSLIA